MQKKISDESSMSKRRGGRVGGLPAELEALVEHVTAELDEAVVRLHGDGFLAKLGQVKGAMANLDGNSLSAQKILHRELEKMKALSAKEAFQWAHYFSLILELTNRCESAYRTYRLSGRQFKLPKKVPHGIHFVFTAHPTEARSPELIEIFNQVELLLVKFLSQTENDQYDNLNHLLALLLNIPMSNTEKPGVEDEARYIYSIVLRPQILDEQTELHAKGLPLQFRTWVGGDKDGHPGVNQLTMKMSLQLSRSHLLSYVSRLLNLVRNDLACLSESKRHEKLTVLLESHSQQLRGLKKIGPGDGRRIKEFGKTFKKLVLDYESYLQVESPHLKRVVHLLWIYPALVLPLEIREDSELVHQALQDESLAIVKMIRSLKEISAGYDPKWYVRGFVLSMVEESKDLAAGVKLMGKHLTPPIPVVPLFENEKALVNAIPILKEFFADHIDIVERHKESWGGRFEVMLGYSDSSKENGVLPSRYLIATALNKLDRFLQKMELVPVFFHGSGGSIERGGGSIQQQTRWWPKSALHIFKVTSQGEMVARNFGNPLIMRGQVEKIAGQLNRTRLQLKDPQAKASLEVFSNEVLKRYRATREDRDFLEMVEKVTPFAYLDQLKIGSRPSKRSQGTIFKKLRAIPWVLCWTQTRLLFPTWWGIGSAWQELSIEDKYYLIRAYDESDFLKSFIKILGFTLAKVELPIFKIYLAESKLDPALKKRFLSEIETEYQACLKFYKEVSHQDALIWFKPWLADSVNQRSPQIHPLNLLQIVALQRNDGRLLRETVAGIACGMLTTG